LHDTLEDCNTIPKTFTDAVGQKVSGWMEELCVAQLQQQLGGPPRYKDGLNKAM
jgi:hypothetical protein